MLLIRAPSAPNLHLRMGFLENNHQELLGMVVPFKFTGS